ncbi:putative beta-hexosaminidase subunit beta [Phaeomoniella chlamydospora]|uniref:Beta-hexosaminidase n=1 Tax=Phaeomoniella chlamydospora TaxID=158046 RepID=A0A0G2ET45_PHACM|nr:putative beta-hexosaminidase subunit beta [Phaeomoniella chlamydospora]
MTFIWILLLSILSTCTLAVWPNPSESTYGDTVLWLSSDFNIVQAGSASGESKFSKYVKILEWLGRPGSQRYLHRRNQTEFSEAEILSAAIQRTESTISGTKFVPWKFHSRNATWEPQQNSSSPSISTITIYQDNSTTSNSAKDFFSGNETYILDITVDGKVSISSKSALGTIRGLQTLEQLFYAHSSGGVYTPYAPVSITDSPKWTHRGVNLDICRNVFGPDDVKRTLDAMATAKFSRLHVHATDAQSWPIVIPSLPTLSSKGAYQPSLVWTSEDLASVQQYGLERGISVFIEIDMPGHTASIAHAFPNLIAAFNELDWNTFAAEPPSGQLKLNSSDVDTFIDTLLSDLLPRVSPYTTNFHTGGDELNQQVHLLDETVRSNSSDVIQPLLQKFVSRAHSQVRSAGLQPISWEEMVLDWNLTLTPYTSVANNSSNASDLDTIIQVWQSSSNLLSVLSLGYRALFGDYSQWYLDCGYGQWLNPYPSGYSPPGIPVNSSGGTATQIVDPFTDYCSPLKNWRHIYVYDPLDNITSDLQPLIHGGEVHLWSEQVDSVSLDGKLWPRAAAAAEVLWSGPRNSSQIAEASGRLGRWRERAVLDHGIASATVTMNICLMGETNCEL